MREKVDWQTLPEHSYERYVAWAKTFPGSAIATYTEKDWNYLVIYWSDEAIAAKVNRQGSSNQSATCNIPKTNPQLRADFLEEVKTLVCNDRNKTHGDAEDNFATIAELWNTYLKARSSGPLNMHVCPHDVAYMMILFKVARGAANPTNLENLLDAAGYAACGGGILKKKQKE